ncbi:MAG: membrane protein insertase YidC [Candidatus Bipolaricaulota bacterium]|nr:membrane protein insertase YidC [Candidatus Bipolaricaulota bacterium]MBS3791945.1 membrane protein insertase YidC [Candidatus Bipolaricaulota bacterium]
MQFNPLKNKKLLTGIIFSLITLLVLVGVTGDGASEYKQPIEVSRNQEKGTIRVRTSVADYLFAEKGGELKSIFIHFSSFRTSKAEIVPGTTTDPETLKRTYLDDIRFPGELSINGESDLDVPYEANIPDGTHYDELRITFTGNTDGLKIEKTFTVYNDANYTLGLSLSLTNESGEAVELGEEAKLYLGSRAKSGGNGDVDYLTDPTTKYIFDGEASNGKLAKGSYGSFGGVGLVGENLVLFLKSGLPYAEGESDTDTGVTPYVAEGNIGVNLTGKELARGESRGFQFSLYGGRRRHVLLSNVGLGNIDEIGFFSQLLVPVIGFLNQLYNLTGNYGWAIILFTILIRVLLYPLMRNMYRSMAKMQELQPKIQEIQDEYDDREEQQKEMMALYKEEEVNPMGGCLPMFVQLPILILLWRAIMYSAEAIHVSPGFLWINDLSMHDPYYILVVLTVGTMIVQQQMMQTPGGGGSQNKLMTFGFPLFMGIFLRNFPAGLWLYYFLTQIFMIGQQAFINWEMEKGEAEGESQPQET